MKKDEIITILKKHNAWRRGGSEEMQCPKKIGIAIEEAIKILDGKEGRTK